MKDVRKIVSKPRKVALYASTSMTDFYYVKDVAYVDYDEHYQPLPKGEFREYPSESAVRISEPVELTFVAISNDEIVAKAVESLNEEERRAIDELNRKVTVIREKRSQLLALTYDEPDDDRPLSEPLDPRRGEEPIAWNE